MRYRTAFFLSLFLVPCLTALAQDKSYPIVRTPTGVEVNHKVPKNSLAPGEAIPARFSKNATDEEIYAVHFFEEPLVPAKGLASPEENNALVAALAAYSQRKDADDFTAIISFLNKYPGSRWRGALLTDLGIAFRRTGYYNQAMAAWEEAWKLLKDEREPKAKVLADRLVSELLLINAWVGRADRIEALLNEINNRTLQGPATERVSSVRRAIWQMRNKPEISFMCGPYALNKLAALKDSTKPFNDKLMAAKSTSKGFSLAEVEKFSKEAGLDYQMAFRKPGSEVIPNAVVHWKLDHYSALLRKESNGRYKCADATMGTVYGQEFWLTAAALDSSASGYFLVPKGALPPGWRMVTADEGSKVFGKGVEPPDNGKHVTDDDKKKPDCGGANGMAQANIHLAAVSLHIYDIPVFYTPPVGPPMEWGVSYHQRDSYQPANFSYSNMGPKWTFKWLSYVIDDPNNTNANADVYVLGGGARTFVSFDANTQSYSPELQTSDVLVRICPSCYELRHPDGSKEVYSRPDGNTSSGRKIFLTQHVDAAGNAISLTYDANLRITSLKDAINQVTTLTYGNSSDIYKITKITDPFGRFASFAYNASGRLISITDMIGIVSSFQYDEADFVTKMTTPYGNTKFTKEDGPGNNRAVEMSLPLDEKERVEFAENADGIPFNESIVPAGIPVFNAYLTYRNTFYWDRKAMKEAPRKYTAARLYHWLHGNGSTGESGSIAPVLESTKEPLENRVWNFYQGQGSPGFANQGMSSQPAYVARMLDDNTTQLSRFGYNSIGADTLFIDPAGRKFSYRYDTNRVDLLEVRQTRGNANELIAKFTYDSQHHPLTMTDASGLATTYTYNAAGQVTTMKNAKNETTSTTYNASGYAQTITGAVSGATTNLTYDGFGRVRTVTDPEGYKVTIDYDALNRPTLFTYPDNSYQQVVYNRMDAAHQKDRLGRWTHITYDSLERPTVVQDALGRVTQLIWCSCGSLSEIVDPLKQATQFVRDLQGRLTARIYADGKKVTYTYENTTSRLKAVTDSKNQTKQYGYTIDDNLKQTDYLNALIATPSVSYVFDSIYNRVNKMTDGTGNTMYAYKAMNTGTGSGQLYSVDGPLSNDLITYSYDSLDRIINKAINGVATSQTIDALGRITAETNSLGTFGYSYVNQTQRLASMSYPNGQVTAYGYYNNQGDQQLQEIWNKTSGAVTLSKFNYEYNREHQITKWTQQAGTATPSFFNLGYDLADRLTGATQRNQSTSAIIKRYAYQYDKAGNRTSDQVDNTITSALYNNVNQLISQQDTGPIHIKGTVNEFSSVLIKNTTTSDSTKAPVDSTNAFEAFVNTVAGTNNFTITATDYSGNNNKTTNNLSVAVTAGINNTLTYDNNGNNIFTAVPGTLYDWDAEDRLVKITTAAGAIEFMYDGFGRRVAEKLNGTIIKRWLWCGPQLCEERNAGGATVTKRFFRQGEQISGVNYYFTRDHLGSVREMTDGSGTVKARYDYDMFGKRTRIAGTMDADFGFTGHYYHAASGLYLTLYRAYDPAKGRWLNRDPAKELKGLNLYRYVLNNPVRYADPYGLWTFGGGVTGSGGAGAGGTISLGLFFGHNSDCGWFSGWSIDLQLTVGGGGYVGAGGSAGVFVQGTNANSTSDQLGGGYTLGGSGGEVVGGGADYVGGLDNHGAPTYDGFSINGGLTGGASPVEGHGFGTNTWGVSQLF